MRLTDNELAIIKDYLRDKPVIRAYVFGSYSRNEADAQSDLDLLVELDYSQHIGWKFAGMQLDLEERLQKSVDLVSANGLSPRISPFIHADKLLIYERKDR